VSGILSSISGYFSKSLILGSFLPVVVFIVLSAIFLVPLLPSDLPFLSSLASIDKEWKVIAVSFIAIVLSGLLYNLNIPILRIYEGYPWKDSWIGRKLRRRHSARFEAAQYRIEAMRVVLRLIKASHDRLESSNGNELPETFVREVLTKLKTLGLQPQGSTFKEFDWAGIWNTFPGRDPLHDVKEQWLEIDSDLEDKFSAYRREIRHNYPGKPGLILPTRLGNVIRSFEYYSDSEYSIDSIEAWPRLVAVIPESYAVSVDDAKTTYDFMMNCSALSLLLACSIVFVGLIFPASMASTMAVLYWLSKVIAFVLISYLFYRLSINRAGAWGSLVKGSFDLYRWALLDKLGYNQKPKSRSEERRLWAEISRQMIYGDRFDKNLLGYAPEEPPAYPIVCGVPAAAGLEVSRGVKTHPGSPVVSVYLRVCNLSASLAAADVTITDRLPDDFDYQWGSASLNNSEVKVTGTNPYTFRIGNLLKTSEALLTYKAVPRKSVFAFPFCLDGVQIADNSRTHRKEESNRNGGKRNRVNKQSRRRASTKGR
jgi:hypothetical protein